MNAYSRKISRNVYKKHSSEDDEENDEIIRATKVYQHNGNGNTDAADHTKNAAENWKGIGNRHMAMQEYEEAYKAYSAALSISPLGPSSHIYLSNRAAALLSLKQYSSASVDARRAITLAPTFGKAHARLGQSLYFLKDYAGAVAAYENAYQFEPDNQVTWTYLNKAKKKFERENEKRRKKDEEEATLGKEEDDAVVNDGTSVTDSEFIGTMAFSVVGDNTKQRDEAVAVLTRQHDEGDDIDQLVAAVDRGETSIVRGKLQAALDSSNTKSPVSERYEQHNDLDNDQFDDVEDPDFDEALRLQEVATIKLVNKDYRRAVEEFSAALFLVPDDTNLTPQLYIGRAHGLNGLERHEGALNDSMMALGRDPELPEAHIVLARTYFYIRNFAGAVSSFETAKQLLRQRGLGDVMSPLDELYYEKAVQNRDNVEAELDLNEEKSYRSSSTRSEKPIPKLKPPRFVSREQLLTSTSNVPPMPKAFANQISSLPEALRVGEEREIVILSDTLGITLNRGQDGIVRVLSVEPDASNAKHTRRGKIYAGDIIREAAGIDLRRPLTNVMWSDTVALMKMAPRPLKMTVAKELSDRPPAIQEEFSKLAMNSARRKIDPPRGFDPPSRASGMESVEAALSEVYEEVVENPSDPSSICCVERIEPSPICPHETDVTKNSERAAIARSDEVNVGNALNEVAPGENNVMEDDLESSVKTQSQCITMTAEATNQRSIDGCNDNMKDTLTEDDPILTEDDPMSPIVDQNSTQDIDENHKLAINESMSHLVDQNNTQDVDENDKLTIEEPMSPMADQNTTPDIDENDILTIDEPTSPMADQNTTPDIDENDEPMSPMNDQIVTQDVAMNNTLTSDEPILPTVNKMNTNNDEGTKDNFTNDKPMSPIVNNTSSIDQAMSAMVDQESASDNNEDDVNDTLKKDGPVSPKLNKNSVGDDEMDDTIKGDGPASPILKRLEVLKTFLVKDLIFLNGDSSSTSNEQTMNYNNTKWLAELSSREIIVCGEVALFERARFFWQNDQFLDKTLVLYTDLLVIGREPQSASEIRLGCQDPNNSDIFADLSDENLMESYLIAETVIDLKTIKLRRSTLTTPSSVGNIKFNDGTVLDSLDLREACFEVLSPSRNFLFSVRDTNVQFEKILSDNRALFMTTQWEESIKDTVCALHSSLRSSHEVDKSWVHQIILGTLHSHVLSGKVGLLEKAVLGKGTQMSPYPGIDEVDDNGFTALHYACSCRNHKAVAILLNAGASCYKATSISTGRKTPCHISAERLDEKSLAIILSQSDQRQPDPNALDESGLTPMTVAVLKGKAAGGKRCAKSLKMCITSLQASGGFLHVPFSPHPVHVLSSEWCHEELEVLYPACDCEFPVAGNGIEGYGHSLGAHFDYPLHMCLVTLRIKISHIGKGPRVFFQQKSTSLSDIAKTLDSLLNHGFEPNERIEMVNKGTDPLNEMIGFTPLQILAAAALDVRHQVKTLSIDQNNADVHAVAAIIVSCAEILVTKGARLVVDQPPTARFNDEKKSSIEESSSDESKNRFLRYVDRSIINMERNQDIYTVLDSKKILHVCKAKWERNKVIKGSGQTDYLPGKGLSIKIEDSNVSGGSDERNCAICWKKFGSIRNRKHICRASRRYVCEDCSTNAVLLDGDSRRVSDGQFNLAKYRLERREEQDRIVLSHKKKERKMKIEQAWAASHNRNRNKLQQIQMDDTSAKEELFGSVGRAMKNFFMEEVEVEEPQARHIDTNNKVSGVMASLNQTGEAFRERGEKLNNMVEKTNALKNASEDFAKMARDLRESQEKGLFW